MSPAFESSEARRHASRSFAASSVGVSSFAGSGAGIAANAGPAPPASTVADATVAGGAFICAIDSGSNALIFVS